MLRDVTLGIAAGDRIGVVGRNGDGKSTLLRLIAGRRGRRRRARDPLGRRASSRCSARATTSTAQRTIREELVGDRADHEWAGDATFRGVLDGLLGGVDLRRFPDGMDTRIEPLSGGERRRIALARLLLGDPELLLLDEPTNHLDVEGVDWLARHLAARRWFDRAPRWRARAGDRGFAAGDGSGQRPGAYLGVVLKDVDPLLPFTLCGVSLALATLGFAAWEARSIQADRFADSLPRPSFSRMGRLLLAMLLLGAGFQVHVFVNAAPLYKGLGDPTLLPWLMPVFWIGFSLAVQLGGPALGRIGMPARVRPLVGVGDAGLRRLPRRAQPARADRSRSWRLAWGGVFLAGLRLAGEEGHHGREGLFVGALFAGLALGAAARIGLTLAGISFSAQVTVPLAAALWGMGALACLSWLRRPPNPSSLA